MTSLLAPVGASSIRAALIRILWRSVADGDACDGQCEFDGERTLDICEAMRALGWARHWNAEVFQRRAMADIEDGAEPLKDSDDKRRRWNWPPEAA